MFKYDEKGENARRAVLADAVVNEYLLGNGPIYLDCRHLPADELDHMEKTLQIDRYTLPAFYQQKGSNFRDDVIEISISELSIRRSGVYFRGSGLAVDTSGQTSVDGLYSAGDCATVSGGIAGAAVLGHIAGEGAVERIRGTNGARPDIDWDAANGIRARAQASMQVTDGLSWKTFENEIRQTVSDYVGVRRSRKGLDRALDTMNALESKECQLAAENLHGMIRIQ